MQIIADTIMQITVMPKSVIRLVLAATLIPFVLGYGAIVYEIFINNAIERAQIRGDSDRHYWRHLARDCPVRRSASAPACIRVLPRRDICYRE